MAKIKDQLISMKRYTYLLENLISRDFKVKYRRSVLGVLWSFLNPILMMLVLNAVFSRVFRYEVQNFPLYLITGQLMFSFFSNATDAATYSVINGASLIKKVYVPKYIFPLEKMLFEFVNFLFSFVAIIVMLIIFRIPFSFKMLLCIVPMLSLLGFAVGFGMILSALCVFFRDLKHLYSVVVMAWMYLTPVFYPVEALSGWIYKIIHLNPLTWYIMYFRNVLIYDTLPTVTMNLICIGCAVVFLVIGFLFFRAKQDKFVLYI